MKFAKPLAALFLLLSLFSGSLAFAQSEPNCSVLNAGQTTEAGVVCVTVNADDVTLEYLMTGDWKLTEAHAWIGDNLANLPVNSGGNPQIGLFPHSATNLGSVVAHSFTIPISELAVNADTFCSAEIFVAAHAVVTRTIAGGGDTGGGGSGGGKSDKSDKSGHSGKSDKSGHSGKSDKSDKSGWYGKSDKSDKSGKGKSSYAKNNGKGKTYNASSSVSASESKSKGSSYSYGSKGKSDKSGQYGQYGKSDKSGKYGHSGKSDKSSKSGGYGHGHGHGHSGHHHDHDEPCNEGGGSGGGTTQPSTQTESAWAGTMQINNGGSWATYFSFTNDFCEVDPEPEDPPVVPLPGSCFNVFGLGDPDVFGLPLTVVPFTPVGVTGTTSAWLNTVDADGFGFGGSLNSGSGLYVGSFQILGDVANGPSMSLNINLDTNADPELVVTSANVYIGPAGSYTDLSPLQYGSSVTGNTTTSLSKSIPIVGGQPLDIIVHAVICPDSEIN